MAHESSESMSTWGYVGVWVGLVVLTVSTYVLGRHVPLGPFSLPTSMGIAVVKTVMVVMFFMHLVEQPGSRRLIFPVAVLYVGLLLGISLLEVMTRYAPSVQGTLEEVLEPRRPAPTRTVPRDVTPPPPHRMPGD